jgi:hypothetical protein
VPEDRCFSGKRTELILRRRLRLAQDDGALISTFFLKSVILSLSKDQFCPKAGGALEISEGLCRRIGAFLAKERN